jgi:hypothetical protein
MLLGTGKKKPKPTMVAANTAKVKAWKQPGYKIAIDDVDYSTKFIELYKRKIGQSPGLSIRP